MTADEVLDLIRDKEVKFVDLRFTDTRGKEMHMTVPATMVEAEFFEDGKMFDGSSIAGWKGINDSDMVLMPDADSSVLDPFTDEATLNLRCDVLEPTTMQGYDRDPRSLAKRAEAYLKSTGIADTAFFGPEPEFFVFDDVRWGAEMQGAFYRIDSEEASWNAERAYEDRIAIFLGYAEAHLAFQRRRGERRRRLVDERNDAPGIGKQLFALGGQFDAAWLAGEQARADRLFQPLDLHADRRLRTVDTVGRPRKIAGFGHRQEGPQQFGV